MGSRSRAAWQTPRKHPKAPAGERTHTVFSYLRRSGRLRRVEARMGAALINIPVLHGPDSAHAKRRCTQPLAGFTLLELLVVMVIIGLLAGFVAPRYFSQVGKSQVKAARAQIDALDKAIEHFRFDMDRLPTTEEGLAAHSMSRRPTSRTGRAVSQKGCAEGSLGPSLRICGTRAPQERLRPDVVRQGWPAGRHGRKRRL